MPISPVLVSSDEITFFFTFQVFPFLFSKQDPLESILPSCSGFGWTHNAASLRPSPLASRRRLARRPFENDFHLHRSSECSVVPVHQLAPSVVVMRLHVCSQNKRPRWIVTPDCSILTPTGGHAAFHPPTPRPIPGVSTWGPSS